MLIRILLRSTRTSMDAIFPEEVRHQWVDGRKESKLGDDCKLGLGSSQLVDGSFS